MDGEALVKEFIQTGRPVLKDQIVQSFAPLVKHVVGRFNMNYSNTLSRDDLYQAGVFGLLIALERYKPDMGAPFKSFAYKRIHGEVVDTLRKEGMIGRDKYDQIKKLETTVKSLTATLGYEPSQEEVCAQMGISEDAYYSLVSTAQMVYTTSLNTKISDDEGEFIYRIDTLRDEEQLSPEDITEKSDLKINLKQIINDLPDRQKLIMALYYYEELTLADIAKVVDLTEARISQILNKTLVEIRSNLEQ